MRCPEERSVVLAAFLYQEEVENWWILEESKRGKVTWKELKGIFSGKYFPISYIEEKRDEFLSLEQRRLSVTKYERKFTELAKYAFILIINEGERCKHFVNDL